MPITTGISAGSAGYTTPQKGRAGEGASAAAAATTEAEAADVDAEAEGTGSALAELDRSSKGDATSIPAAEFSREGSDET